MSAQRKIDAASENACHSGLEIFSVPPTDVSVLRRVEREILPLNALEDSVHAYYEFRVFSDNQWLDLSETYLYLQLQMLKKDTTNDTWVPLTAADTNVAPIQYIGQSFVKHLKVHMNGVDVYDSGTFYPYINYIRTELSCSKEVKDAELQSGGYYVDSEQDKVESHGFAKRAVEFEKSAIVALKSRMNFDLAHQNRYLLNNVDVAFTLYRMDDKFLIQSLKPLDTTQYRLKVHGVKLYVTTVDVQPSLNLAVMGALEKRAARYPIRRMEARTTFLTPGRTEVTYNAFTNVVPRRLILGLLENGAYCGDFKKSPFNFKPFSVKDIAIHACGLTHPSVPYNLEWSGSSKDYINAFTRMHSSTAFSPNSSNGITKKQFESGWTFFVFTLSPNADNHEGYDPVRNGTTTVTMKFKDQIPDGGVSLVVLGEFDQLLSIDQNRIVVSDNSTY